MKAKGRIWRRRREGRRGRKEKGGQRKKKNAIFFVNYGFKRTQKQSLYGFA